MRRRRPWRKLPLGIDEPTTEIIAVELSGSRGQESQPLPARLEPRAEPLEQVWGDGAYDTRACYAAVRQRASRPIFVPRRTAQLFNATGPSGG